MSLLRSDHGGIIKKRILNNDYLVTMANAEVNMNLDGTDTVVEHGGIIAAPETSNYNAVETPPVSPNIAGVEIGYVPPPATVSGLIIDHGGPIKPRTIVNDEQ